MARTAAQRPPASLQRTVAATEFKATCLSLMDEVADAGTEIIVTKHGRPVAKLVPITDAPRQPLFGAMKGSILWHGDIVSPNHDMWAPSTSDPLWGSASSNNPADTSTPAPTRRKRSTR